MTISNQNKASHKPITPAHIEAWLGTDANLDEALILLAEIANGEYSAEWLVRDVSSYNWD